MQPKAPAVGYRLGEVDELLTRHGITDLYGWWNGPQPALDGRTPAEAWIVGEYAAVAAPRRQRATPPGYGTARRRVVVATPDSFSSPPRLLGPSLS